MKPRWKTNVGIALGWLVQIEQVMAVILLATLVITMAAQVIWRYVLQSPLSWSEEIARLAMIWLTFIAAGFVTAKRQHIAVDLIGNDPGDAGDRVAGEGRSRTVPYGIARGVLRCLRSPKWVSGITLVTTLSLLVGGLRFVWHVHPVGSPGVNLSMSYWYGAASVGLALISIHTLADLLGIPASGETDHRPGETANRETTAT